MTCDRMLIRMLALVYETTWLPMMPRPPWWRPRDRRRWDIIVKIALHLSDDVLIAVVDADVELGIAGDA